MQHKLVEHFKYKLLSWPDGVRSASTLPDSSSSSSSAVCAPSPIEQHSRFRFSASSELARTTGQSSTGSRRLAPPRRRAPRASSVPGGSFCCGPLLHLACIHRSRHPSRFFIHIQRVRLKQVGAIRTLRAGSERIKPAQAQWPAGGCSEQSGGHGVCLHLHWHECWAQRRNRSGAHVCAAALLAARTQPSRRKLLLEKKQQVATTNRLPSCTLAA